MAQINLDAARTTGATTAQGDHTVTFSSDTTFTLAGPAAIAVDNTATWAEVMEAVRAALRALKRQRSEMSTPAALPTSGSTRE